jgi:hypothetical protein
MYDWSVHVSICLSLASERERDGRPSGTPHTATKKTARLETQDVFRHHWDTFLKVASATRIGLVGERVGQAGRGRGGRGLGAGWKVGGGARAGWTPMKPHTRIVAVSRRDSSCPCFLPLPLLVIPAGEARHCSQSAGLAARVR